MADLTYNLSSIRLIESSNWSSNEVATYAKQALAPYSDVGVSNSIRQRLGKRFKEGKTSEIGYEDFFADFRFLYLLNSDDCPGPDDELTREDEEKYGVVRIAAKFCASYLIDVSSPPTNEQRKEWAESHVLSHCWPYWREYCNSMQLRMSVPVIIFPLLAEGHFPCAFGDEGMVDMSDKGVWE